MTFNRSNLFTLFLFHLLLLLHVPTQLKALNTDGVFLLSFKYSILNDPLSILHNWNYDDETPCLWTGVSCTTDTFRVTSLILPNKHLLGSITPDLFSIQYLKLLDLTSNYFNGSLPDFNTTELQSISLGNNNLSGVIPKSVTTLQLLNLSANAFTGNIPNGFNTVEILDLSSNELTSSIPQDLGGRSLLYLNFSHNKLSGNIPPSFAELFPVNATVDISYNTLTGQIPSSLSLLNQKVESFSGNTELCGKPLQTLCSIPSTLSNPPNGSETTSPAIAVKPRSSTTPVNPLAGSPPDESVNKSKLKPITIVGITVGNIAGLALLGLCILYVYQVKKRKRKRNVESNTLKPVTESPDVKTACSSCLILNGGGYDETSTSESDVENQKSVEAFDKRKSETQLVTVDGETRLDLETLLKASAYVLGNSGTGIVYKAVVENGTVFAVRRIETESCVATKFKEFEREVRGIAKIRHPNLVKIRGFCWGNDEKLLISDYVPNGSLLSSIITAKASSSSSSSVQNTLSFRARLRIARGMARGLSYINEKKQVHGNIKPSNILLDGENEPIITDLGLDRLMTFAREPHSTVPTYYQPPEWSTSPKPNPKWDVYSFGVILLELLTGKTFSADDWSNVSGSETEEKSRFLRLIDGAIRSDAARLEDAAITCFRLGIECVSSLPQKRTSIKEVLQALEKLSVV